MKNILRVDLPRPLEEFRTWLVSSVSYSTIQLVGRTMSFQEIGAQFTRDRLLRMKQPVIIVFWHNRLFFLCYYLANYFARRGCGFSVMVSASRDGDYITGTIHRFKGRVVRGSSSRGGKEALAELLEEAHKGITPVVTPDGPRGPRYILQPGAVILAQKSGLPLIPLAYGVDRAWIFNSWDRLVFPKPFSHAYVVFGDPIWIPRDISAEERQWWMSLTQQRLNEVTERADGLASRRR